MKTLVRPPVIARALVLIALLAVPLVVEDQYIRHTLVVAMLYAIVAANWDVTLGFAGIFNFGHLAFFALGAYSAGMLTKKFGFPTWTGIPFAALVATIASLIVCLPVLRLKGIYVVLVTYAFSQLCYQVILNQTEYTGGTFGLVLVPPLEVFGYSFRSAGNIPYYYLALALLVVSTVYLHFVIRSNLGRSIIALRDNEAYAISRGVALARQRFLTFGASAIFTGAAGGLYAQYLRTASPDMFGFAFVTFTLAMLLLGGIGTMWGPIIGAFVFTFISEAMIDLKEWRWLIIGTLIVVVLRFFPAGLLSLVEQIGERLGRRLQPAAPVPAPERPGSG
ncbi:MAG: branched-chain amino acid ABC transporter permease [Alphaproteobacteria bacterium]|nr:branched-chain amino acid ABC transporter permease [Alphaproteobacteria bacterium]